MVVIGGREKLDEFVELLDFKTPWMPGHCMCFGEVAFRLERGGKTIKKITFHHATSLRWCSLDRSTSNFNLTESSRERLVNWLEKNGAQALRDAQAEAEVLFERVWDDAEPEEETVTQPASSATAG